MNHAQLGQKMASTFTWGNFLIVLAICILFAIFLYFMSKE